MNHYRYREVSVAVLQRLKLPQNRVPDRQIYYYNKLSMAEFRLRNVDSALAMARVSQSLLSKTKDSVLVADTWKVTSYAFNHAGTLDSALFYTRLLLGYAERHNEEHQMRNALVSVGTIMAQNGNYTEALKFYRKAAYLTLKIRDTSSYPISQYNLGLTHINLNNPDSGLFYLRLAAESARKQNHSDVLVYVYGTMADCYLALKDEKERKKYLLLANIEAEKTGNKQCLAMGFGNLARGAIESGDYNEALQYASKAQLLLKEQPYLVLKISVDSLMWVAHRKLGHFQEALSFMEAYMAGREILVNEHQKEVLNKLTMSLEVKEKDLTIANQTLEITAKKRKIEVLMLLVILIFLLATGQFIYVVRTREYRRRLFHKEKELDQYTQDVKHWLDWKNSQSEAGYEKVEETESSAESVPADQNAIQVALFNELRDIFDSQKLYLDPELNLKTVIKLLGTNKKYLYQAISENSDDNFRSFINRYRVNEAKFIISDKLRKGEELNLTELYSYAGFNSSVSFYRAFKTLTGLTPKDYAIEIRNELRKRD